MTPYLSPGKLHLHPVTETHQFRPTLTYLDALSRKSKRGGGNDSDSDEGPPPDPDDPTPVTAKREKKPAGDAKEVQVSARRADDKSGATVGGLSAVRREMLHILRVEEDEAWEPLEFCDVSVRTLVSHAPRSQNSNSLQSDPSGSAFESVFSTSDEPLQCRSNVTTFIKDIQGL